MSTPIRIGIVAGEVSGDNLGAGLMRALKERLSDARFEGIGGPRMQAEGCASFHDMERLSIIGLTDLKKIFAILAIRRRLARHFLDDPPDLFIGIDAPDFNLGLEQRLKIGGIPTVHYVSPTVWAWRGYRIRTIHKAVDLMLTLFPFEAKFYERHNVPVTFVGHPLADEIPERWDHADARRALGLAPAGTIIALLPGSRVSELHRHAELFVRTAQWLHARHSELHFVAPFVNAETQTLFDRAIEHCGAHALPITSVLARSREAMAAANLVLVASGTATLEAALLKRPMVVTYKVSPISALLLRLFAHVTLYSLPNNLAGREIVPELMQQDATPEKLGAAMEHYLLNPAAAGAMRVALAEIHAQLRQNADMRAAQAVTALLGQRAAGSPAAV